ncbi:MAG TPA: GerMN domain-containing protein, partial [Ilumatobacter sp.]|nr:GerMN domain-containing protein [Ilumatobacter sp.]
DIRDEDLVAQPGSTSGSSASGANRIFLVAPGDEDKLSSVPRNAVSRQNLIEVLLNGPNEEELDAQYLSNIPSGTEVLSTRSQGNVLTIDLSRDLIGLTGGPLAQAVAQIVYTATELDGVEAVQITVEGELLPLPKGNGDSTTGRLQVYDYPNFVITAQPPYPAISASS